MAQVGLLEDNPRIAKLCATMLDYAGYRVTVYRHPQECLHALLPGWAASDDGQTFPGTIKVVSLPIEVLILDLHLPDIDGLEVLRRLQSHPHTRSLPLIFCTAATAAEVTRAFKVAPHATLVEKPFKVGTLISAIAAALRPVAK